MSANGNNVEVVFEVTREMATDAREGRGPSLLIVDTYRWREHCGPNYDNDLGYRTVEEYATWRKRCPVESCRLILTNQGVLTADIEDRIKRSIDTEISVAFEDARNAPFPEPETAALRVYA